MDDVRYNHTKCIPVKYYTYVCTYFTILIRVPQTDKNTIPIRFENFGQRLIFG